jgi:hypothetical protein
MVVPTLLLRVMGRRFLITTPIDAGAEELEAELRTSGPTLQMGQYREIPA